MTAATRPRAPQDPQEPQAAHERDAHDEPVAGQTAADTFAIKGLSRSSVGVSVGSGAVVGEMVGGCVTILADTARAAMSATSAATPSSSEAAAASTTAESKMAGSAAAPSRLATTDVASAASAAEIKNSTTTPSSSRRRRREVAAVMAMISIALKSTPTTDAIAAANIDEALVASLAEMPANVTAAMI